jgi:hydrogenase expression/formation protein HypC
VCVAIPCRLEAIDPTSRRAVVVVGGVRREIDLTMTPEVGVGDWVVAHSGFAVRRVAAQEASEVVRMLDAGKARSDPADFASESRPGA